MKRKLRRQKAVKGGRIPVSAGLIKDIEMAIQSEMKRYNVSRSFVIAVALSHVFKIEEQEQY